MRAGFEVFKTFEQDAKDFAAWSATKLHMPFLVLTGEKASGDLPHRAGAARRDQRDGRHGQGAGHWLMEEAPGPGRSRIVAFLG